MFLVWTDKGCSWRGNETSWKTENTMYETWKGYSILEQAQSHFCRRLYFYGNKHCLIKSVFARLYRQNQEWSPNSSSSFYLWEIRVKIHLGLCPFNVSRLLVFACNNWQIVRKITPLSVIVNRWNACIYTRSSGFTSTTHLLHFLLYIFLQ